MACISNLGRLPLNLQSLARNFGPVRPLGSSRCGSSGSTPTPPTINVTGFQETGASGTPYSTSFTVTGGAVPYTVSVDSLPDGVNFDPDQTPVNGVYLIEGTPDVRSYTVFPVKINVTDSNSQYVFQFVSVRIDGDPEG